MSDPTFSDFISYTDKKGLKKMNEQLSEVKSSIKLALKARIAKNLFGEEGYYAVLNDFDPCIHKALFELRLHDPLGLTKIASKQKK